MSSFTVDTGPQIVTVHVPADAELADWYALSTELQLVEGRDVLGLMLDAREAPVLTGGEARELGRVLREGWVAVAMLTQPGVRYGVARIVQAIAEVSGRPVRAFTDAGEAESWIRVRVAEAETVAGNGPEAG